MWSACRKRWRLRSGRGGSAAGLLGTHYRQPADFTDEALLEAKRTLDRFYGALDAAGCRQPDADADSEHGSMRLLRMT